MNWSAFILAAAVALTLDASLMPALEFAGATPSLVGCLAAFVALHAERRRAWWGCWTLGLLVDLSSPVAIDGSMAFVPGPNALAFTLGAALVLSLRAELMRRSMIAAAVATLGLLALASLAWTMVWTLRGWGPDGEWPWTGTASSQLLRDLTRAAVTAVLALPVSWLLARTFDHWGFPASRRRR
jgi:rod shape-determining protein MreD